MHRLRNISQRGISLGEVTLATAVIGGATLLAMPKLNEAKYKAKESVLKYELQTIRKAVETFSIDTGGHPVLLSDLLREDAPSTFVVKGHEVRWGKRPWHGPYLAYGEKGSDYVMRDPVSEQPFLQRRNEKGRLQVFSSAKGKDTDGKLFSDY
jgi:type II secretory pathway pseudopilin PulG